MSHSSHDTTIQINEKQPHIIHLKQKKRYLPNYFLFTRLLDRQATLLYLAGITAAVLAGLAFPSLDLLYGNFTSSNTSGSGGFSQAEAEIARSQARVVGLGILGVGIGELIFTWAFLVCFTKAGERMGIKIRNAYLQSVLRQDITFFDTVGAGEVAGRTTKDIAMIQGGIGEKAAFAIWCFTTILVGVIIGFIKAPRMAGVLLALIPFTLILYAISVRFGNKYTEEELEADGKAGNFLDNVLGSVRIVQAFSAENILSDRYYEYLKKIEHAATKKAIVRGSEVSILFFCVIMSFSLAFWWGSRLLAEGSIGLGPLTTTFFVFLSGLFSIAGIVPQITSITESAQVQARIFRDIDRIPEIDSSSSEGFDGDFGNHVDVKEVTFSYPSRPTLKSLDDVSLRFEANQMTAIVGYSGSGKSTVTALLLRFYDPQHGSLSIGGHDVRDINITHLRRNVAMCSQNPTMFNCSVFENIAYGMTGVAHLENLSDEKKSELVREAATQADAIKFIEALPKGFNTKVGTSGAFLSGGQRQRIAIARALIRDPKVLILDEATSALDSSSEKRVYSALADKKGKRTTIVIAHRISTIKDADKIVVMGTGRVLEQGKHDELLAHEGAYKELVDQTNANNFVPGMSDNEEEDRLPSEKQQVRRMPPRMNTYDGKGSQLAGSTHGSYMSRISTNDYAKYERRPENTLLRVPTEIEANPKNLESPKKVDEGTYSGFTRLQRYTGYSKEQRPWLILGIIASALIGAAFPSSGYLVGRTIEALARIVGGDQSAVQTVANYALYFFIIALVTAVTGFCSGFFLNYGAEQVVTKFRNLLTRTILKQEVGFFDADENSLGSLTSGISSNPSTVAAATGLVLSQLLISLFNLTGSIILAFVQSWKLAAVCLSPVTLFVVAAYLNVVILEKYESEGQSAQDEAANFASDNIGAIREVQALTREVQVHDHYAALLHPDVDKVRNKYLYTGVLGFAFSQALVFWISGLTFWWGSQLLSTNQISETAFYSSFEAVIIASFSTGRASAFIPDISRAFHSMKLMLQQLDRRPLYQNIPTEEQPTKGAEIVFKGVSLRYPSRPDITVLENFDLQIKAGQKVAFCGHSGGGKTSTLSLLQRFYDPEKGSITFDGQDIRKLSLASHRARMALVSQDAVLYEGTIEWNLRIGSLTPDTVTQDELIKAATDANILEFIESLPEGFNTTIGLKGSQLSGGQKQRLCIARALLRNPSILLLDEATSALDATSERAVQKALDVASKGRTTITIAHRLSTISNADVIYVVESGAVVEGGSHRDLLERRGKYFELVQAQLG